MLRVVSPDEPIPASTDREEYEKRIRKLTEQVSTLQAEVATLRARHLRADERDSGIGSLLTEREASFSDVERLANVGSWIWDVRTNEVAWSEQAFRIFGYDPAVDLLRGAPPGRSRALAQRLSAHRQHGRHGTGAPLPLHP
jgi:PAS domain-containing protein